MAAGIAGLMKLVLVLRHGQIPPHLHLQTPNPHIDWASSPVCVPTALVPWPDAKDGSERIGGVSSFGFSGTNAHVIVSVPVAAVSEEQPQSAQIDRPAHLLTISAKSAAALQAYAQRYEDFLAVHPDLNLGDLCYTSHVGRSHFLHRLAIAADSLPALQAQLSAFRDGRGMAGRSRHTVESRQAAPKLAFLFTGQGSQYANMGRTLYETEPAFRTIVDHCDESLHKYLGVSLLSVLYPKPITGDGVNADRRRIAID